MQRTIEGTESRPKTKRLFRTFTGPTCVEAYAQMMLDRFPESEASAGTEDIYWTVEADDTFHAHETRASTMTHAIGLRPWRTFPNVDLGTIEGGA